jgi:voltage-dependent anion channel protein 2
MAPPKFADLDKKFRDLLKDDFGFGAAKLTIKSKTSEGVNIKVEESRKLDDGSVSGLLEVKYTNAAHGLTVKDTWDTKNVFKTEVTLEGNPTGNKFTVTKTCNNGGSLTKNWVLKHEFSVKQLTTESVFDGAALTASAVFNYEKFNFGVSAGYDVAKSTPKTPTVAASYTVADTIFNAAVANGADVTASIFHLPCANTQLGVELAGRETALTPPSVWSPSTTWTRMPSSRLPWTRS